MRKSIKNGLRKTQTQKFIKRKYMSQMFRFCCRCVRMSLIDQHKGCHFCGGKFIVSSLKDDLKLVKRNQLAETH